MISTTNALQGLAGKGQSVGAGAPATGEGFLDALLTKLPPEAQGLSLQELIEWLREQGDNAAAGLVLPQVVDEALPSGLQSKGSDPADVLNWIMSSRQNMASSIAADAASSAVAGDNTFQTLLQPVAEGEDGLLEADAMLRVPVRHPDFGQAVGERLVWMVRNESQEAKIRLDPPSLGPLEISVSIKDDRASVVIHANHAVTRELLDTEAPRLRAMLGEQGFAQVDVDVSRDSPEQRQAESRQASGAGAAAMGSGELDEEQSGTVVTRVKVGLVDQYV